MRGLVASVSSMKWRREVVCTRRKATCVDFSWQRTVSRKDLVHVELRVHHRRVGQAVLQQCGQGKNQMKNFVVAVLKGLKREIDFLKAIGSMEVGVTV